MNQRNGYLLAAGGAALILAATLWPSPGGGQQELSFWCLLCGGRDVGDALLNLLLFIPFGSGLAVVQGPALAVGGSLALSGMIELIQTTLPGRHSDLADILANTTGGATGAFLTAFRARIASWVVTPTRWVKILAGLLPPMAFAVTAILSAPSLPEADYFGQWARQLGTLRPYPGRVISASIGGLPLPDHRLPNQEAVKAAFRSGEPLLVEAVAGREPDALSHLFAVYDERQREVVLFTVQRSDLFYQRGTRSVILMLDQPFVRWNGALDVSEGDTFRIMVRQEAREVCLEVGLQVRCDLSGGVAAGWRLFHRLWGAPPALVALLSVVWLSILSIPAGAALGGEGREVTIGLSLGLMALAMSWWVPWLSPHLADFIGPIPGALAGRQVRDRLARRT